MLAVRPLHPPGRVAGNLDPGLAGEVADLPGRSVPERLDVELGRKPEVALAPGREPDVAADARNAEGADVLSHEVLADDVPRTVVLEQCVRVDRPFLDLVT